MEGRGAGAKGRAHEDRRDTFALAGVHSPFRSMLHSAAKTVASVGGAVEIFTSTGHTGSGALSGGEFSVLLGELEYEL